MLLAELATRARREIAAQPREPLQRIKISNVNAVSWHPDLHHIAFAFNAGLARVYDISVSIHGG